MPYHQRLLYCFEPGRPLLYITEPSRILCLTVYVRSFPIYAEIVNKYFNVLSPKIHASHIMSLAPFKSDQERISALIAQSLHIWSLRRPQHVRGINIGPMTVQYCPTRSISRSH